ncbi:hypothetical protein F3K40_12795 [Streptomyces sp. LBUM 1478]|nr:hypothetical protein [Streptomyces sp. LBUM 1485]MBP5893054.1 hypothetical protein [Streptomyces sp. LBUM 1481]MBP5906423.1 hypothetical protein [Streptomyces sp. LBUM 1478]MBP5916299.1 hypothetical protein [Streptomyces sp. LBUM 1486]MBP5923318.1 hypothetical protein [Streptomyces sp. LBUM 1483]MBP5930907.1 hypothetical protein [Streptomyces sp. LBUM 1479]MBP5938974.1 hypothetical protein [Streptomyces sp. LBUM 1476]QTU54512.1 hypothetical protein F3K21_17885 [Streptomyces sp. LBUM 1480]
MRLQPHAEARTRLRRSTTPSFSRLTAQHQEIEQLREQAAAAGNVRRGCVSFCGSCFTVASGVIPPASR